MKVILEPLTPSDADLRDLPSMLLDVERIRRSRLAKVKDPEAFRIAVLSWCAAWHEVPAGSLPDNDEELADLLGFGRAVGMWTKLRSKLGLYGWVKCSADGRLYHPVMAEKVHEALASRMAKNARTEAAREAAKAARERAREEKARLKKWREGLRSEQDEAPPIASPRRYHIDFPNDESLSQTLRQDQEQTQNGTVTESATEFVAATKVREGKVSEEELASLPSDSVLPRGGGGLPPPSGSASLVAASPALPSFQAEPEPASPVVLTRDRMPRLNDPPGVWYASGLGAKKSLDDDGIERPTVCGFHIDVLARQICEAAGMNRPYWRGDWWTIANWLHSGFGSDHILGAIRERRARFGSRWKAPDMLVAFDTCVREYRPQRSAA